MKIYSTCKFSCFQADLIHLGAKFAPCMRMDEAIHRRIIETRDKERQTACCIRNDNSGCVQSSRNECSVRSSSNMLIWHIK